MLKIEDLCFGYSRRSPRVLNGIDLELNAGEIGIILGRNGSGKTTLFKNILGINEPDSGRILFDGEDLLKMPKRERDIIILRFYSGKTLREISSQMGISYAYVKVLQNKAFEKLKKILLSISQSGISFV